MIYMVYFIKQIMLNTYSIYQHDLLKAEIFQDVSG